MQKWESVVIKVDMVIVEDLIYLNRKKLYYHQNIAMYFIPKSMSNGQ